jgi:mRNA interferase YafQ
LARELIILPRFKRDYRSARKHPEFDAETLAYVFDLLISGTKLPDPFREHRLARRVINLAGFRECHLGTDLILLYRVRRDAVVCHRIGTHQDLFTRKRETKRGRTRLRK